MSAAVKYCLKYWSARVWQQILEHKKVHLYTHTPPVPRQLPFQSFKRGTMRCCCCTEYLAGPTGSCVTLYHRPRRIHVVFLERSIMYHKACLTGIRIAGHLAPAGLHADCCTDLVANELNSHFTCCWLFTNFPFRRCGSFLIKRRYNVGKLYPTSPLHWKLVGTPLYSVSLRSLCCCRRASHIPLFLYSIEYRSCCRVG